MFSPDCFTELGIDAASKRFVVVKSTQHFRAHFDAIAGHHDVIFDPDAEIARIVFVDAWGAPSRESRPRSAC